jgi:serine/threonine protein kinase
MFDGRGRAVITDFGLAGLADQIEGLEARSGTPAYMSTEQLAGKEVTVRSDIYSLGLVFYEIFTGKRAFEAETLAELVRARGGKPPSTPSSHVKDLDPAVERLILRCLEPDPVDRPATVLAIATGRRSASCGSGRGADAVSGDGVLLRGLRLPDWPPCSRAWPSSYF